MEWYPNIPKIMHCYWSASVLSYLRFLTIKTFSKFNPDWKIKFYYPKNKYTGGKNWNHEEADFSTKDYIFLIKDIPNTEMIEIDFDSLGVGDIPEVYRSDLLRLKLLGEEGGLWSDMDIIYFKSLEEAYFNIPNNAIDTIISYHPIRHHYSIGFLGSKANNPFYQYLYSNGLKKIIKKGDYQSLGIVLWHSCFQTPKEIVGIYPSLNVLNIGMDLCYSLDSTQINQIYDENTPLTNPKTIALHWYCGHPKGIPLQNIFTEDNFKNINNTIAATVRRALEC